MLKDAKAYHSTARERKFYDNVAAIVMAADEVAPPFGDDEKLVGELQKKYDTLKDKLFLEVSNFAEDYFAFRDISEARHFAFAQGRGS